MSYLQARIKDIEYRYFRLECNHCNHIYYGTRAEYSREMSNPDSEWTCGHCGNRDSSSFDDEYWEQKQEEIALLGYIQMLEDRIKFLEDK